MEKINYIVIITFLGIFLSLVILGGSSPVEDTPQESWNSVENWDGNINVQKDNTEEDDSEGGIMTEASWNSVDNWSSDVDTEAGWN